MKLTLTLDQILKHSLRSFWNKPHIIWSSRNHKSNALNSLQVGVETKKLLLTEAS